MCLPIDFSSPPFRQFLTPFNTSVPPSSPPSEVMKFYKALLSLAALAIPALAGAPDGPESVFNDAGYIEVGEDGHNLFYWMFESRNEPATDPVLLWMSGGPGCSSQLAMFGENGPYIVEDDLSLTLNPDSWNNNATVIWIDQPVGTGFSYGGHVHNEEGVGKDMYDFIHEFLLNKYDGKYKDLDFHVFGESYAGHYVPAVSREIVRRNAEAAEGDKINLVGMAIGNGLTDPETQYQGYIPFSEEHGLVSSATLKFMGGVLDICEPLIHGCNNNDSKGLAWSSCMGALMFCNIGLVTPIQATGINVYDVREQCEHKPLCYDFDNIDKYLAQDDVLKALGIPDEARWVECNKGVDIIMQYSGDWMKEFGTAVAEIVAAGVNTLIYAGEYDFICNWMGNNAWTLAMDWDGHDDFNKAENKTWTTKDGAEAGSYINHENFTFLKVKDAGHMVPRDQPANSMDMVRKHFAKEFA